MKHPLLEFALEERQRKLIRNESRDILEGLFVKGVVIALIIFLVWSF